MLIVAPRVGAWIETQRNLSAFSAPSSSHPVWVRGLKPLLLCLMELFQQVAPRVGAWIETCDFLTSCLCSASHPVWVRGLKRRLPLPHLRRLHVAPRVGAWIETHNNNLNQKQKEVAPRVGAWIETRFCSGN